MTEHDIAGRLSPAEREHLPTGPARRHYLQTVDVAGRARNELHTAVMQQAPIGTVLRLANTYAWASRALWLAAQAVCDLEDLDDEGKGEGIKWEIPL